MSMVSCSLQPDPDQPDLLSALPDELLLTILSSLPTHIAAQTSVLSRRFCYLWEASPSLHLCTMMCHKFVAMCDRSLLYRNPSHRLLSLHLDYKGSIAQHSYIPSLLDKAHSLGLRHLKINGLHSKPIHPLLPSIFSIDSLQSLSLSLPELQSNYMFPSGSTLACLRTLSLKLHSPVANLSQFISELCSLEYLHLETDASDTLSFSSKSIRKLSLIIFGFEIGNLELFLPLIESLHLKTPRILSRVFNIKVPLLKKAVISPVIVHAEDVNAVTRLLSCISHVQELSLHIMENWPPDHILLQPAKDVPNFHNMKRLDVNLNHHVHSYEAIIFMFHNCPNLESLKFEVPNFTSKARGRKRKYTGRKLHSFVRNFHSGENREEFMKLLTTRCKIYHQID